MHVAVIPAQFFFSIFCPSVCLHLPIYLIFEKVRYGSAKAAFDKKKNNLFTSKLDINLRKRLLRCYVWC